MDKTSENAINRCIEGLLENFDLAFEGCSIEKLPTPASIREFLEKAKNAVFYNFFSSEGCDENERTNALKNHLETLYSSLKKLARTAFACEKNGAEGYSGDVIEEKTVNACNSFFDALPGIAEYIRSDIKAAFDGDPAADNYEIIMTAYPGIKAIFAYRVAHALLLVGVPFVPRIMTECAHSETGIDIHPGATIGKSFFIDHGTGVVIGETAIIGERVKLYQGVTIGAKTLADARTLVGVKRHPTIEDDVTVYSGATILGGDTIVGKGAVIGSSAFVLQSVPAGAKVSAAKPTTA